MGLTISGGWGGVAVIECKANQ